MTIWEHASSIADAVCAAALRFDKEDVQDFASAEHALHDAWLGLIEDARLSTVSLEPAYLSDLHSRIASAVGARSPGDFVDGTPPNDWSTFMREVIDGTSDGIQNIEHYIVSQLYSGSHVQSMRLTLGWFCMCGLRLQQGHRALFPTSATHDKLILALADGGPDCWDPSEISVLFDEYVTAQAPPNTSLERTRER